MLNSDTAYINKTNLYTSEASVEKERCEVHLVQTSIYPCVENSGYDQFKFLPYLLSSLYDTQL